MKQSATKEMVRVYLVPTPAQLDALEATLEAFAGACAAAVAVGRRAGTTSNAVLHRFSYRTLRETFGLSANLAVRAIARAARQLKDGSGIGATPAVIDYDARTLSFSDDGRTASLSTVAGRIRGVALASDDGQRRRLGAGRIHRAVLRRPERGRYQLEVEVSRQRQGTVDFEAGGSSDAAAKPDAQ